MAPKNARIAAAAVTDTAVAATAPVTVAAIKAATSKRITLGAASALAQGLLYEAASLVAIGIYQGAIPSQGYAQDENRTSLEFPQLLTSIYLREDPVPELPVLAQPRQIQSYMIALAVVSALWATASLIVLVAQRCCGSSAICWYVHLWVIISALETVVDVSLIAVFSKDLRETFLWDGLYSFPGDQTALILAPGLLLVLAARGATLLIVNIVLMLWIAYDAAVLRVLVVKEKKAKLAQFRHHTHDREDPLHAFVFDDGPADEVELGTWNPAFEPEDRWSTFRPVTARDRPAVRLLTTPVGAATSSAPNSPKPLATSKVIAVTPPRIPEGTSNADVYHHLSWMEQPENHVPSLQAQSQHQHGTNGDLERGFKIPRPDYTPPTRPKERLSHRP